MKDLELVSIEEQKSFFDSFDYVFVDQDGVLCTTLDAIPGADKAVQSLQNLNKTVVLVSNNTTKSIDAYHEYFKSAGFNVDKDKITTPILVFSNYLKKINFDQELYVIGMAPLKNFLRDSGFKLVDSECVGPFETVKDYALATAPGNSNVRAVICDIDININLFKLQKACTYLRRSDVLFLGGAPDTTTPLGQDHIALGPGCFHKTITDMTGKKPIILAKPSQYFGQYLIEKFKISDNSKVLFVGDAIPTDMGLAASCGFKKLLVLTGISTMDDVQNWSFPEEYKPDYYVDSLGTIHDIIMRIFGNEI